MLAAIVTEYGLSYGSGHLTRCLSLYDAFLEKGVTPKLIIKGDFSFQEKLEGRDFIFIDWEVDQESFVELLGKFHFVIIDSYIMEIQLYEKIGNLGKELIFIDDFNRLPYPKGKIVCGSFHAYSLPYDFTQIHEYYLGKKYILLRKQFWDCPPKIIRNTLSDILVSAGEHESSVDLVTKVVKIASEVYPSSLIHVIAGRFIESFVHLKNDRLVLYPSLNAQEIFSVFSRADIAISAGGMTAFELCRMGVPLCLVSISENQILNSCELEKNGIALYCGSLYDSNLPVKLRESLISLANVNIRKKMSVDQQFSLDGKGARRVVNLLVD